MTRYLITSALPYANGPLHFGHLSGAYLPADIYARFRKLQGYETKHVCGSDEHGVAIMLNAQKAGKPYQEYVQYWHEEHNTLFKAFDIQFDIFGQTSAKSHHEEAQHWFTILFNKGLIEKRSEEQLYCNACHNHLPDRFVEGTCYVCQYPKARGDECPECGEWIKTVKLIHPQCKMCGSDNISIVQASQYYLLLSKFHQTFRTWFAKQKHWRHAVYQYVDSLSEESLHDRAITRDLDWGIDVPLTEAKGKKLYVWFDAPIGYVSNLKEHLKASGEDYLKDWWKNKDTKIIHFIGKDNIIFHSVIFPCMAMGTDLIDPPYDVAANQYLTLEGKQFSKSTGHYVDTQKALETFGVDALRYYLISILPENHDSSFSWEQFKLRVNGELANNIGNFIQRALMFMFKNFPEGIEPNYFNHFFLSPQSKEINEKVKHICQLMEQIQLRSGLEHIMILGQYANTYFSDQAPWNQIKQSKEVAKQTIASSICMMVIIAGLLSPYLPTLSHKVLSFLFKEGFPDKHLREFFSGDSTQFAVLFKNGLALHDTPKGFVPKIEDQIVQPWKDELEGMNIK